MKTGLLQSVTFLLITGMAGAGFAWSPPNITPSVATDNTTAATDRPVVSDGPSSDSAAPARPIVSDGPVAANVTAAGSAAVKNAHTGQANERSVPADAKLPPARQGTLQTFTRFSIYSARDPRNIHYAPSGYMGDSDLRLSGAYTKTHNGQGPALRVYYTAAGSKGWSGLYWQDPADNWASVPGRAGYDLRGATKLTFWARGETGGEKIHEIRVGGIIGKYPDSDVASIGPLRLTSNWKQYTIDLRKSDLRHIIGGFGFFLNKFEDSGGITFYLDDIQFEGDENSDQAPVAVVAKGLPVGAVPEEEGVTLTSVPVAPISPPTPPATVPVTATRETMAIPNTFHSSKHVHAQSTDTGIKVSFSSQVLFAPGRATLSAASSRMLDETVPLLTAYPTNPIIIEGHTDSTGDPETNMTLSRLRAASVRDYYMKQGYDPTRFKIVGFGDTKPVAENSTADGRAQNRRVEITILKESNAQ